MFTVSMAPKNPPLSVEVERGSVGLNIDGSKRCDAGDRGKSQRSPGEFRGDAVNDLAHCQAVSPVDEVSAALEIDIVIDEFPVVGGFITLEIETVVSAVKIRVDKPAAKAVEAVAGVVVVVGDAGAHENLVSAVEIGPKIADELPFAESVVVVVLVVDRIILRGEISAEVDEGALAGGDFIVGQESGIHFETLKLLKSLLKLEIAGVISDLAKRSQREEERDR